MFAAAITFLTAGGASIGAIARPLTSIASLVGAVADVSVLVCDVVEPTPPGAASAGDAESTAKELHKATRPAALRASVIQGPPSSAYGVS